MTQKKQSTAEEPVESQAMQTLDLEFLSLSSYTRLCTMISICLGFAAGIIFVIADVLGVDPSVHFGIVHFDNIEAGVIALFTGPFVFAVVGFVGSFFSYRLFPVGASQVLGIGSCREMERCICTDDPKYARKSPPPAQLTSESRPGRVPRSWQQKGRGEG